MRSSSYRAQKEDANSYDDVVRDTAISPDGWKLISGEKGWLSKLVRSDGDIPS